MKADDERAPGERSGRARADGMIGLALLGAYAAGVLALVVGLLTAARWDTVGAGICFLAAGTSFGLAANALLRK